MLRKLSTSHPRFPVPAKKQKNDWISEYLTSDIHICTLTLDFMGCIQCLSGRTDRNHTALLDDGKLVSCFSDHKDSAAPVWAPGRQSHTHRSPKQTRLPAANIRGSWEQGCGSFLQPTLNFNKGFIKINHQHGCYFDLRSLFPVGRSCDWQDQSTRHTMLDLAVHNKDFCSIPDFKIFLANMALYCDLKKKLCVWEILDYLWRILWRSFSSHD